MLDMVRIDGVDYYNTLAKTEYYAGQDMDGDALRRVMSGCTPTGEKLVQNAGTESMRVGMDLTFSAPKSVSVLWANAPEELREQISHAHAEAVAEAMEYLRQRVETRTGKGGTQRETPTALIYASFEHCDTREKDPSLHTHTVLSNAVIREDGQTSAIDQNGLYVHKLAAGTAVGADVGATIAAATEAGLKIGRQAQAEKEQSSEETALKNAEHRQEMDKWVKTQTE